MKIIVPMAGLGKRMRPHTLTVAKPLIPVAGKPVVQWLVEDIIRVCGQKVDEIAYVVGRFGAENEKKLIDIAASLGAKGTLHYQDEPLGTAHAILCAKDALSGPVVVAFADTLFRADFTLDGSKDGIIWVKKVDDPSAFGVVKTNSEGIITDFVEKPKQFVSDQAIIGIYYFRDGDNLRKELQHLIDNNIRGNNEYQLTDALENMKQKGIRFATGAVEEWLDCGNKNVTVYTNQRVLENRSSEMKIPAGITNENSIIIPPCYIGENVVLRNSVVGPHVSVGNHSVIENSVISNSILQNHVKIAQANISNSMIGNYAEYKGHSADLSMGDYTITEA